MRIIDPATTAIKDLHQYIVGGVAPRPIAWVSTVDPDGVRNLAPYSFFNAFSSNPPILVFSSNRRVKDNTTKDTLSNVQATKEVVINVVPHRLVRQMALTSVNFPKDVDEFEMAGLTPVPSDLVKPYRIQESPIQFECVVNEIFTLGEHGGAGHLIVCQVVRIHIDENILDGDRIDPDKLDLMGRLGRAYYARASGSVISTIVQEEPLPVVGYPNLPESWKQSSQLTANHIAQLAGMKRLPSVEEVQALKENVDIQQMIKKDQAAQALINAAKKLLDDKDDREQAARLLFLAEEFSAI